MGRRRADGGRAFSGRQARFLRELAADRCSSRPAAELGHGLPAVLSAGSGLLFLGLANRLPHQRDAGRRSVSISA